MIWFIIGLLISLASIVVFFVGLYGVFNPKPFKNNKTGKVPSRLVMLGFAIFVPFCLIILAGILFAKIAPAAAATPKPAAQTAAIAAPAAQASSLEALINALGNDYEEEAGTLSILSTAPLHIEFASLAVEGDFDAVIRDDSLRALLEGVYYVFNYTDVGEATVSSVPMVIESFMPRKTSYSPKHNYQVRTTRAAALQALRSAGGPDSFAALFTQSGEYHVLSSAGQHLFSQSDTRTLHALANALGVTLQAEQLTAANQRLVGMVQRTQAVHPLFEGGRVECTTKTINNAAYLGCFNVVNQKRTPWALPLWQVENTKLLAINGHAKTLYEDELNAVGDIQMATPAQLRTLDIAAIAAQF